ncbi:hypothetical protein [Ferrimonas sediminum]|uniref:hypothetical protein n=1 Tax=Ferrimonas sediminum TaxID=718193 RepID=UPI000B8A08AD|nr:hypothetical protein [Ferrimonas sediminum]
MKQYSVVRIKRLKKQFEHSDLSVGTRAPRAGDVATVVDVYDDAFDLECSDDDGSTLWLELFRPDDADLDIVSI